jgi:hypothetical protein
VISGSASMAASTAAENRSRSTARAAPAGTAWSRAMASSRQPRRSSSSFSKPLPVAGSLLLKLLEQTISARPAP